MFGGKKVGTYDMVQMLYAPYAPGSEFNFSVGLLTTFYISYKSHNQILCENALVGKRIFKKSGHIDRKTNRI